MTDERKKFLEECEDEFKDRYTEKDTEFMKMKNLEPKKAPIIDTWSDKSHRSYEGQNQRRNRGNHNNWERRNYNNWERRNYNHWERRDNEQNDRCERAAGKHFQYHRTKPY